MLVMLAGTAVDAYCWCQVDDLIAGIADLEASLQICTLQCTWQDHAR